MTRRIRLDLPLLLPDLRDARDECVNRLTTLLEGNDGITRTHVLSKGESDAATLCLHYDPDLLSLRDVEQIATAAGASVSERYGHAVLPIRAVDAEDAARRIEEALGGIPGVLNTSVNLAAQRARVEFDRTVVTLELPFQDPEENADAARPARLPGVGREPLLSK